MDSRNKHKNKPGWWKRGHRPASMQYDWLPADDEANVHGFWVPTPAEIEAAKAEILADPKVVQRADPWKPNPLSAVPTRSRSFE